MDETNNNNNYDPNTIISAADARLASGDLEGGQLAFQSALLDWVDHARESATGDESLRDAIATLWLAYAAYLRKAKQNKSAMDAYEQATNCPIAGSRGMVWLDYARFADERDKKRTAQQIYLRALVGDGKTTHQGAVTDEQDRQLLWNEFLEFMRKSNPSLTLSSLQAAVENEHLGTAASSTSPVPGGGRLSPVRSNSPGPNGNQPPNKRSRWGSAPNEDTSMETEEESKTHVVTAESVEAEAQELLQRINQPSLPPEVAAAWMVRDGDSPPQPPPPLFGPTPPKLSDPSGKDMLGEELALKIMQCLLRPSGSALLEVCSALWTMTALQEDAAARAMEELDKSLMEEHDKLEATLDNRLSVAGAAHSAVVTMNDKDRENFKQSVQQQRLARWSELAWQFRQLMCVQQQLLTHMNVPGFDGPTVDASDVDLQQRICSFLHSAFYLRNRIGEDPHRAMLKSQAERLKKLAEENANSRPMSRSVSPVPPSFHNNTSDPRNQQHPVAPSSYNPGAYIPGLPPPPPHPHMAGMPPPQHQPVYGGMPPMGYPPMGAQAGGLPPPPMGQQPPPPMAMYGQQQQLHQQQPPPHNQQQQYYYQQ